MVVTGGSSSRSEEAQSAVSKPRQLPEILTRGQVHFVPIANRSFCQHVTENFMTSSSFFLPLRLQPRIFASSGLPLTVVGVGSPSLAFEPIARLYSAQRPCSAGEESRSAPAQGS